MWTAQSSGSEPVGCRFIQWLWPVYLEAQARLVSLPMKGWKGAGGYSGNDREGKLLFPVVVETYCSGPVMYEQSRPRLLGRC